VDATGLQTVSRGFENHTVGTLSDWGWHTIPNTTAGNIEIIFNSRNTLTSNGRQVPYADVPGNKQTPEIKWPSRPIRTGCTSANWIVLKTFSDGCCSVGRRISRTVNQKVGFAGTANDQSADFTRTARHQRGSRNRFRRPTAPANDAEIAVPQIQLLSYVAVKIIPVLPASERLKCFQNKIQFARGASRCGLARSPFDFRRSAYCPAHRRKNLAAVEVRVFLELKMINGPSRWYSGSCASPSRQGAERCGFFQTLRETSADRSHPTVKTKFAVAD